MRRFFLVPLVAGLAGLGSAAQAQIPPEVAADVQCAVVVGFVPSGENVDPVAQQATAMYFIGKLAARGADYRALIPIALVNLTQAELAAAGERCGNELVALGNNLDAIGNQLQPSGSE